MLPEIVKPGGLVYDRNSDCFEGYELLCLVKATDLSLEKYFDSHNSPIHVKTVDTKNLKLRPQWTELGPHAQASPPSHILFILQLSHFRSRTGLLCQPHLFLLLCVLSGSHTEFLTVVSC